MKKTRTYVNLIFILMFMLFNTGLSKNVSAADYNQGVDFTGSKATIWFHSLVNTTWIDVHYTVNSGGLQNVRMKYNESLKRFEYGVDATAGTVLKYFFTYNNGSPAYDTSNFTYTCNSAASGNTPPAATKPPTGNTSPTGSKSDSASIYSIAASSIPNPSNGGVSVKIMNGTNRAYADDQLYWGVIGINPSNGVWSYLDLSGKLIPISAALNDAAGHLTKNGKNYANIYHKVSETSWVNLPKITSGRMFLSVGSPCYIKTYDNGFAGPDINNSTDPNRDVYFDFVEFTVDGTGYHGNTTRVDQFGFPVQHRLVNRKGDYDHTVGELEAETRSGLFKKYLTEVPNEFKSLAELQAPYRIICPISGPFNTGGTYSNYFGNYSGISTRDILLGIGGASNPEVCAAINRHVYSGKENWNKVGSYYKAAPANYYAKFWHDHSINGLAYGFCYDDVNGQAAYLEVGDPKGLIIRIGW